MSCHLIWLVPLLLGVLPLPVKAFPSDDEIAVLAERFCQLESASPQDYEEVFVEEFNKWINSGSVTLEEVEDEASNQALGEAVGDRLGVHMAQKCPRKIQELQALGIFGN
ncbi:MAG: hypothetical protein IGR93_16190 [Hydrococcus sp. C42_A2020_068]|nr:hypothetical protein [Hydrococcus sp. C42_A2020_068]